MGENEWDRYVRELVEREKKAKNQCYQLAKKYFPEDEFEIKRVNAYFDDQGRVRCLVDFKNKYFEPFDCGDYCWASAYSDEEYEECVETCEENLEAALTNSVEFLTDGTVLEATIAGDCGPAWCYEDEEYEEFERRRKEFFNKFDKIGCKISEGWIHPHELIGGTEWEEPPATCFYHMEAKREGMCRVDKVLDAMREVW